MASHGTKRNFSDEMADDVSEVSSTPTIKKLCLAYTRDQTWLTAFQYEEGEPTKRLRNTPATPGKPILRPNRSSHAETPPSLHNAALIDPAIRRKRSIASPTSTTANDVSAVIPVTASDVEDKDIMDVVNLSFDRIEVTVLASRERGDRYKKAYVAARKDVSDLRLENAEGLRELKEARATIGTLVQKNERLEAQNDAQSKRHREAMRTEAEKEAAKLRAEAEEKAATLVTEKEEAVERYRSLKGQAKRVNETMDRLADELGIATNYIAYLETLLAFEEQSGYSSMLSELQLECSDEHATE